MKKFISRQWKAGFETYVFLILIAIELLMSFTFFGYIHIAPISITTAYIPILITGNLLGPVQTTIVSMIFGLASMFKATAHYVMPVDQIFSPFLSGNPLGSLLLSVGAMLALCMITGISLIMVYQSLSYRQYLGELDDLTGLMGRKMFFAYCETLLTDKAVSNSMEGYFIFLDVDFFKSINDTQGHPVGDKILKGIAKTMQKHFSPYGLIGRVGGDEFIAFLYKPLTETQLRQQLDFFLEDIADLHPGYGKISCSIGVSHFTKRLICRHFLTRLMPIFMRQRSWAGHSM